MRSSERSRRATNSGPVKSIGRARHRLQHAVRDVGGAGVHEELPAAWDGHCLLPWIDYRNDTGAPRPIGDRPCPYTSHMEPTPFSILLSRIQASEGESMLDVPEDWLQGRTLFGGLQAVVGACGDALAGARGAAALAAGDFPRPRAGRPGARARQRPAQRQERDACRGAHRRWRQHARAHGRRFRPAAAFGGDAASPATRRDGGRADRAALDPRRDAQLHAALQGALDRGRPAVVRHRASPRA